MTALAVGLCAVAFGFLAVFAGDRLIAVALLAIAWMLALSLAISAASAHPATDPNAEWYQSLMRPDMGTTCRSGPGNPNPDCLTVQSRQTPDGYEALIDDRFPGRDRTAWEKVPPEKILQHSPNPTGSAVACWLPSLGILCFVRGVEA